MSSLHHHIILRLSGSKYYNTHLQLYSIFSGTPKGHTFERKMARVVYWGLAHSGSDPFIIIGHEQWLLYISALFLLKNSIYQYHIEKSFVKACLMQCFLKWRMTVQILKSLYRLLLFRIRGVPLLLPGSTWVSCRVSKRAESSLIPVTSVLKTQPLMSSTSTPGWRLPSTTPSYTDRFVPWNLQCQSLLQAEVIETSHGVQKQICWSQHCCPLCGASLRTMCTLHGRFICDTSNYTCIGFSA